MLQKLIHEKILSLGINFRYARRMLGLVAGTKKEAGSFRPDVVSDIEIPHQRSIMGKESRVARDEQVSTKALQREWSGFAAETPRPRACGIDDDASINVSK
jgi:hypothetical protein